MAQSPARLITFLLLMITVFGAAPSPAAAAKRVALVIGNDAYERLTPLRKAVNDARSVKAALDDLGFEVIAGENLTRRDMNRKLSDLEKTITPGDLVFFFYAGHGVAIGAENYLLPVDMPLPQGGEEGLVRNEGLSADAIIRSIQERGAATTFVVLDACRNNPIAEAGTRSVGLSRGLARIDAPTGVFILFSAGIGQTALDRLSEAESEPNSVFTRKFVPLLMRPGLSHVDLAKELQKEVAALAAMIRHRQEPAYYDQIIGLVVLREGGPGTNTPPPAGPLQSEAERAWAGIKDTTSTAALEAFVKRFGDTFYGDLAQARLEELKRQQAILALPAPAAPANRELIMAFDTFPPGPLPANAFAALDATLVVGSSAPAVYSTQPNMLLPAGRSHVLLVGDGPVTSLSLKFNTPITRFSLTRVGTAGGASVPTWGLHAFDARGNVIASTGEVHGLPSQPRQVTVEGQGIAVVQLNTDNRFGTGTWATWNSLPVAEFRIER